MLRKHVALNLKRHLQSNIYQKRFGKAGEQGRGWGKPSLIAQSLYNGKQHKCMSLTLACCEHGMVLGNSYGQSSKGMAHLSIQHRRLQPNKAHHTTTGPGRQLRVLAGTVRAPSCLLMWAPGSLTILPTCNAQNTSSPISLLP